MRSVVVVLPASMWAMIPMLRTLARSVSTSSATGLVLFPSTTGAKCGAAPEGCRLWRVTPLCWRIFRQRPQRSPAVVREGLVRLGHLVRVLAALHARPEAVARIEQLVRQALDHGLLPALAREGDHPAQRERGW